jgi:hypothetical protein
MFVGFMLWRVNLEFPAEYSRIAHRSCSDFAQEHPGVSRFTVGPQNFLTLHCKVIGPDLVAGTKELCASAWLESTYTYRLRRSR